MYYILYEGLQIESNEPVYCTLYTVHCTVYTVYYTVYSVQCTVYSVRCIYTTLLKIISFKTLYFIKYQ